MPMIYGQKIRDRSSFLEWLMGHASSSVQVEVETDSDWASDLDIFDLIRFCCTASYVIDMDGRVGKRK